eukprot:Em0021g26a
MMYGYPPQQGGVQYGVPSGQQASQQGGVQYGVPSGQQAPQQGGVQYGVPSGQQAPQQGGVQYGVPSGQQASQQGGVQYGVPSGQQAPQQGGVQYGVPSGQQASQQGGVQYGVPSGQQASQQGGVQYGVPSGQQASQQGGVQYGVPSGQQASQQGGVQYGLPSGQQGLLGQQMAGLSLGPGARPTPLQPQPMGTSYPPTGLRFHDPAAEQFGVARDSHDAPGRGPPPGLPLGPNVQQTYAPSPAYPTGPSPYMSSPPTSAMGPPTSAMGPPTGGAPPTSGGVRSQRQGPPGMALGPPGMALGPSGMVQRGPSVVQGPAGMVQRPGMMVQGPPGMAQGPPGMTQGLGIAQGPPGMVHGPGMAQGPPGMVQGLSGNSLEHSGMQTGPGVAPVQQQPRLKIDSDQMPNPITVMKQDHEQRASSLFCTTTRGIPPPLVTTQFTVQDDGNSSPRYMRATMYAIPCTKDMVNSCRIPMGLVIQPLATIPSNERSLQLVDHGTNGPIRCNRCKCYINPYCRFIDGGRHYICPICEASNEVPMEYFAHLDHQGRRTDCQSRPELCYGSVEFVATLDYCKEGKSPKPPGYIFVMDVSQANIQNGLLTLLSSTLLSVLQKLPGSEEEGGSPIQVGFITYDKVIHFYNVKSTIGQPQMMVMTDVAEVFVPMVDGFLVSITESQALVEMLLSQLPEMFSTNKTSEVILEPVIRAAMESLKAAGRNGRIFVFHSGLPSHEAPGVLKNRLDPKLLGTEKEKTLLCSAGSGYPQLAEDCVKAGVAVELFLFPSQYCDVATLGDMATTTGGEVHLYQNFRMADDGERFVHDLQYSVARPTVFDAVMRVRASTGLRPTGFYGAFFMSNTTDIELGSIDSDKVVAVEIKHDDKLKEEDIAFFQAALLYTNIFGQRRLRIHNLALNCSSKFADLYRSCEVDTIMNFLSKSVTKAAFSMVYKTIRDNFTHQVAVILACYRKQCSSQSPPGQLILPESLKLMPMYANCLLKSDALLAPPMLSMDEKSWLMYCLLSMPLKESVWFLYPRMMALHDVDPDGKDLPPLLRCTGQKLQENGVYLIENGFVIVLWIGQNISSDFATNLFGVPSSVQIPTETLPALDNPLSFRVRGIIKQLQTQKQHCMKLYITKQRDKTEGLFRRMLKEDKGAGQWESTTYTDFLCQIHRDIKEELT